MLSRSVRSVACLDGLARCLYRLRPQPRILMFHRVGPPELTAEVFHAQLGFLARNFRIVTLAEVWQSDRRDRGAAPRIALTFDLPCVPAPDNCGIWIGECTARRADVCRLKLMSRLNGL